MTTRCTVPEPEPGLEDADQLASSVRPAVEIRAAAAVVMATEERQSADPLAPIEGGVSDRLISLLAVVADQGWGSDAGRQAVGIMQSACRREAAQWTRRAGWLTDEGLAVVWEQIDRLVRMGRFADAPGLLKVAVRRAYAAEAAAAQTCMGSIHPRSHRCRSRRGRRPGQRTCRQTLWPANLTRMPGG